MLMAEMKMRQQKCLFYFLLTNPSWLTREVPPNRYKVFIYIYIYTQIAPHFSSPGAQGFISLWMTKTQFRYKTWNFIQPLGS